MIKIGIDSDFRDWYDHIFYSKTEKVDQIFSRIAHDPSFSIPKPDQFSKLEQAGLFVPENGLPFQLRNCEKVVVYTDPLAHCGEGKILVDIDVALRDYKNSFCSQWIQTHEDINQAVSYRHLQIGNRAWWLRYEGKGNWMSNHADETTVTILEEIEPYECFFTKNLPIYAIDYVKYGVIFFAIDLNTAPGTKHTGLENILRASDVYDLVEHSGKLMKEEEKSRQAIQKKSVLSLMFFWKLRNRDLPSNEQELINWAIKEYPGLARDAGFCEEAIA